jgi:hypothetical protein
VLDGEDEIMAKEEASETIALSTSRETLERAQERMRTEDLITKRYHNEHIHEVQAACIKIDGGESFRWRWWVIQ